MASASIVTGLARLVRWPNLLIIAGVQWVLYYCYILPTLTQSGVSRHSSNLEVGLFILVTMLIAACGNVINDYMDQATDAINAPSSMIVGKLVPEKTVLGFFAGLFLVGLILSMALAAAQSKWLFLPLYPAAVLLLVIYSKNLKGVPVLGNILIAVFCSAVFPVMILLEVDHLSSALQFPFSQHHTERIVFLCAFAFWMTWLREMVKDVEDLEGDRDTGCETLAVKLGVQRSKSVVLLQLIVALGAMVYYIVLIPHPLWQALILYCISIGILILIVQSLTHWSVEFCSSLSKHLKGIMVLGILYFIFAS